MSSVKIIARNLAKYKLDLVAVQEVRWGTCDSESADDHTNLWKWEC
jgi:hypothetical protein